MSDLLPVTQADRDAVQAFHRIMAKRIMSDIASERPKLGEDEGDAGTLVQAFARHRLASATPARGGDELREAEQWLRAISDWLLTHDHDMTLPDGILDTDPLDIADRLAALASTDMAGAGETEAEVQRILAMSDEQVLAEATADDVAWARGFEQGLKTGSKVADAKAGDTCAACGFPWGADPVRHAEFCHNRTPTAPLVEGLTSGEGVGADRRAHAIFDQWDKHPDAPAYWFRLPSWVQDYATACVAATERRLAASPKATATASVREATVEDHNAAFDPADEAFGGAFRDGFREGWIFAQSPDGSDYDDLTEQYQRAIDIEPSEAWQAHRDQYFAMLPLTAIPEVGSQIATLTDSGTAATIGGERA